MDTKILVITVLVFVVVIAVVMVPPTQTGGEDPGEGDYSLDVIPEGEYDDEVPDLPGDGYQPVIEDYGIEVKGDLKLPNYCEFNELQSQLGLNQKLFGTPKAVGYSIYDCEVSTGLISFEISEYATVHDAQLDFNRIVSPAYETEGLEWMESWGEIVPGVGDEARFKEYSELFARKGKYVLWIEGYGRIAEGETVSKAELISSAKYFVAAN